MMKWPITFALVLTAFFFGYFLGQRRQETSLSATILPPRETPATDAASAATVTSKRKPKTDSVQNFTTKLLTSDFGEQRKLIAAVPLDQQLAYADEILRMSGPDGLPYELKRVLEEFLKKQMTRNPRGTMDWILNQEQIGFRDSLLQMVMRDSETQPWVQQNFDNLLARMNTLDSPHEPLKSLIGALDQSEAPRAVALSKKLLKDHRGMIDYPPNLQQYAIQHSWQAAFEFFKDCWLKGNTGSSSSWGQAVQDFDYQSFAAAWAAHEASLNLDRVTRFYLPPTPVWKWWSQIDPQAALDFVRSGGSRTFSANDFFDGYEKVAKPSELYLVAKEWAVDDPKVVSEVASILHSYLKETPAHFEEYMALLRQTGDLTLVGPLLLKTLSPSDGYALSKRLVSNLSPAQQMQVIRDALLFRPGHANQSRTASPPRVQWAVGLLTSTGHSQAEIDALFGGQASGRK